MNLNIRNVTMSFHASQPAHVLYVAESVDRKQLFKALGSAKEPNAEIQWLTSKVLHGTSHESGDVEDWDLYPDRSPRLSALAGI